MNPFHYVRQTGLIDPEKLNKKILIVGAGGIGSWTTLALLKMGCVDVTVVDFDSIEVHNVGSQIYTSMDEGKLKVEALKERLFTLTEIGPNTITGEFSREVNEGFDIVISAVDNMEARQKIWQSLYSDNKYFIDGRMAGNAIEIYTTTPSPEDKEFYQRTLFSDADALPIACSERAVIYNCFIIAGLIADLVSHICNEKTPPREVVVDLANFQIFT